jgi:hypothetical protein
MLNPKGYVNDDRYFDAHRGVGSSVTDADPILRGTGIPNMYAQEIISYVTNLTKTYPPLLVMDHHEDEMETAGDKVDSGYTYNYCYGESELLKPLCREITTQLILAGFPIREEGKTRFNEDIHNGFVTNSGDGSVDELLAHLGAQVVFVLETTRDDTVPISLESRVTAQKTIIGIYPSLWAKVTSACIHAK